MKLSSRKYVPHLPTMQALCEHNYARLLRLMPDIDPDDKSYRFRVTKHQEYKIQILETARFTTTLAISQTSVKTPQFLKPKMTVQMYHDARMAEVISSQNTGAFAAKYDYPNAKMRQPNEKHMINLFLAEWLQFCLTLKSENLSET